MSRPELAVWLAQQTAVQPLAPVLLERLDTLAEDETRPSLPGKGK